MTFRVTSARAARAKSLLVAIVVCLFGGVVLQAQQSSTLPTPVKGSDAANRSGRKVALKEQLRVGLKATTKEDLAFINLVVAKVDAGRLPRDLVDGTFLWARNRYKTRPGSHRLRPIVYFRPALTARAKAIGVTL